MTNFLRQQLCTVFVAFMIVTPVTSLDAQSTEQSMVIEAAKKWLLIVDEADYDASYKEMAGIFRDSVRPTIWRERVEDVRATLGKVATRDVDTVDESPEIRGAPPGDYMIIRFTTKFGEDPATSEAVTMFRESDGLWRSVGYYVQKKEK